MKKYVFVAMLNACVMSFVCLSAAQQAQTAGVPKGAMSDKAQAGSIGPGTVVEPPSSDVSYAPTAAQIAAHELLLAAKSKHLAPPLGPHTTAADVARAGGPPTDVSVQQASPEPAAATTFTVFKKRLINSICSGCAESTVNEPSAANSGKNIVETSNWNIAYSLNNGSTWLNQDPYTLSPGFCCDTQVVYDQDRDVFILLLLDYAGEGASTNGLTLSVTRGQHPAQWCTYKFTGANFGEGSTDTLDFPKIALSNNNLFLTWNDYPPNAGFAASGIVRMPLAALASCGGFNYTYITRSTEFTFALAQQPSAYDKFYWVSNWMLDGTVNGQNLRIFQWADNTSTYFWNTKGINAYTFGTAACGSPGFNWCSRLDPRSESVVITPAEYRAQANSAFAGDQILEVAATSGPSSLTSHNYVVYNYFKLNSLTYIGNDQTFNTTGDFAYPSCGVNEKGYVGCAMAQGFPNPGGFILLQDNVNPTQPWGFNYPVLASGGASAWGDYTETNPWHPGGGPFETVLWNVSSLGAVQPYWVVWGRGSDANDFNRWNTK